MPFLTLVLVSLPEKAREEVWLSPWGPVRQASPTTDSFLPRWVGGLGGLRESQGQGSEEGLGVRAR